MESGSSRIMPPSTARIVAARMNSEFESVDDAWRRSDVPMEALVRLTEADALLPSLKLERRDALGAIKASGTNPCPCSQLPPSERNGDRRAGRAGGRAWADDGRPQCGG